jgi:hypothetical protein
VLCESVDPRAIESDSTGAHPLGAGDFNSVDLPAPFAPATQTISPFSTSMLTAEIATSPR